MSVAAGSLWVGDANGRLVELPIGAAGTVLGSDGTTAGWVTPSGGGSGGVAHSVVGYNTIGSNWETMPTNRVYATPVTLSAAGLLVNVSLYCKHPAAAEDDRVHSVGVALYTDFEGAPHLLIGSVTNPQNTALLDAAVGAGGDDVGRWYHVPLGIWLDSGAYWLAVQQQRNTAYLQIAYDGDGADRYYTAGGAWFSDWGFYAPTTTGNAYSIRASVIR